MAESHPPSLPLYEGWAHYQALLLAALAPLTPAQLAERPGARLRAVGENAAHIVGTRAGWLYYVLGREEARLQPFLEWQGRPDQPVQSAADLCAGLQVTWQAITDALHAWSAADLEVLVEDTDEQGQPYTVPRRWVIWHLIEHDLHHGGEISVALGIAGLPGIAL